MRQVPLIGRWKYTLKSVYGTERKPECKLEMHVRTRPLQCGILLVGFVRFS